MGITLKQLAYQSVKSKILDCSYEPGRILNEQQLCQELSISRTPVRDALSRLEQEGLVSILPKKGILVTPVQLSDIHRIFEVRMLIEPYTLRRYGDKVPLEELVRLKEALLAGEVDGRNYYQWDDRIHSLLLEALPNQYLQQTYSSTQAANTRFRILSGRVLPHRIEDTTREHLRILQACEEKNWEKAARAMESHLKKSRDAAVRMLMEA